MTANGDAFRIGAGITADHFRDKRDAEYFFSVREGNNYGFEHYAGPAAFILSSNDALKVVAASQEYLLETSQQLCCAQTAEGVAECLRKTPLELNFQKDGKLIYQQAVLRAAATGMEQECETWRAVFSQNCGQSEICLSARIKLLASCHGEHLLYVTVRNITAATQKLEQISSNEEKFRSAADQANLYAWEYNILTREMRPCSRCMRDLGLPPVVRNYPEPLIASGLFPEDYADMYRGWHRQLEQGVEKLEGIIPLTPDRIPFHVRYTTEFDADHRPVRAFASATLVVDKEKEGSGTGMSELFNLLSKDYHTVLQLDFVNDNAAMVRYGQNLPGWLHEQAQAGKTLKYTALASRYLLQMIHPDDLTRVQKAITADNVLQALAKEAEYSLIYRVLYSGSVHFMQLRYFRLGDETIICAVRNYDLLLQELQEAGMKL